MGSFLQWLLPPLLYRRVRAARQAMLLSMLAVAVERGISLIPFLEAMADETSGRWGRQLQGLADLLAAGVSLPNALDCFPGLLPREIVLMIRVGAESGALAPALREAAAIFRHQSEEAQFLSGGTTQYVVVVAFVMMMVGAFISYWIVPKYLVIFEGFGMELPPLTRLVIDGTESVAMVFLLIIVLSIVGVALSAAYTAELTGFSSRWRFPSLVLGRLLPRLRTPHILRNLSFAAETGRPLESALATMTAGHPDLGIRARLIGVEFEVARGGDWWANLRQANLLAGRDAAVLAAAQRAGNLGWALRTTAQAIERRREYRFRILVELVRPVVLLAVAALVGLFVAAMFLPVVKIIEGMK